MKIVALLLTPNSRRPEGNRPGYPLMPRGVTVHRTGDPGATARNIRNYFDTPRPGRESSAHYIVDASGEIVRCIPENEVAWHAGPRANRRDIGIETCEPLTPEAYAATVELVADIHRRYGWKPVMGETIRPHSYYDPVNRPEDTFSWSVWLKGHDDPEALYAPGKFLADVAAALAELQRTPIMGKAVATAHQLCLLLRKRNADAPDYAQTYLDVGARYGVRGDVAFCQSIHETGAWRFGGQTLPEQNNFAGLGATNGGPRGAYFATPQLGIEAQIQHLYLYANAEPLPAGVELIDPRWEAAVSKWGRGAASNVEDLAGKWAVPGYDPRRYTSLAEAFAAEATYGQTILKMLKDALTYPVAPNPPADPFSDVEPSRWSAPAIRKVCEAGLMLGSDGKFNPTAPVTREQLAVVLARLLEKPPNRAD